MKRVAYILERVSIQSTTFWRGGACLLHDLYTKTKHYQRIGPPSIEHQTLSAHLHPSRSFSLGYSCCRLCCQRLWAAGNAVEGFYSSVSLKSTLMPCMTSQRFQENSSVSKQTAGHALGRLGSADYLCLKLWILITDSVCAGISMERNSFSLRLVIVAGKTRDLLNLRQRRGSRRSLPRKSPHPWQMRHVAKAEDPPIFPADLTAEAPQPTFNPHA